MVGNHDFPSQNIRTFEVFEVGVRANFLRRGEFLGMSNQTFSKYFKVDKFR